MRSIEYDRKAESYIWSLSTLIFIISRDLIRYCLRRKNTPNIIKDIYDDSIVLISITVGETGEIEIKIGLHEGSVFSPLLFIIIMDVITEDIEEEARGLCYLLLTLPCLEEIVSKKKGD